MAAQQRAHIEVPFTVTLRAHRDRDTGENHGQQAGESEISFRALQRTTDTRLVIAHIQKLMIRLQARREPGLETREFDICTGEQRAVDDATARLHNTGARNIGLRDQHARREGEWTTGAPGFIGEHARERELRSADFDARTDRDAQRLQ